MLKEEQEMEEEVEGALLVEAQPCRCCLPLTSREAGAAQEPPHAFSSQGKFKSQSDSSQEEEEDQKLLPVVFLAGLCGPVGS